MSTKKYFTTGILGLTLLTAGASSMMADSSLGGSVDSQQRGVQERAMGEIVDDLTLKNNIVNALAKKNSFNSVNVKVMEGRVLLTGKVPGFLDKLDAIKTVWEQDGVKEIDSEITVTNLTSSASDIAADSLITSKVKSQLLTAKNIRSMNYGVETIDRVVYILGIAQNQGELNKAIDIAKSIKDVKNVVSYVRVKN